jgi:hypothetical protein
MSTISYYDLYRRILFTCNDVNHAATYLYCSFNLVQHIMLINVQNERNWLYTLLIRLLGHTMYTPIRACR